MKHSDGTDCTMLDKAEPTDEHRAAAREWYLSIWPGAARYPEVMEPDIASLAALLAERGPAPESRGPAVPTAEEAESAVRARARGRRLSTLALGREFRTLLTGRLGTVIRRVRKGGVEAVLEGEACGERRILSGAVHVEALDGYSPHFGKGKKKGRKKR